MSTTGLIAYVNNSDVGRMRLDLRGDKVELSIRHYLIRIREAGSSANSME